MSTMRNMREIMKVVNNLGIAKNTKFRHSSKSIEISVTGVTGTRKFFAACTPSDFRNFQNMKSDLKRVAAAAGALNV